MSERNLVETLKKLGRKRSLTVQNSARVAMAFRRASAWTARRLCTAPFVTTATW
jgi:hypothetical protein